MPYLTLIGLLAAAGLVFYGLMVWVFARTLLTPTRMTDGRALALLGRMGPADVGLADVAWQLVEMVVRTMGREEIFKSWWIPAAAGSARPDTTLLLVHGFADSKIGALAWLPVIRGLGVNILMVDLRAHGEAPGPFCSAGHYERHDLLEIGRQARMLWPAETKRLVLLGMSLGGLCAAAAVGLDGPEPDLMFDGLILDSPPADFREAVGAFARMMNMPGKWIQRGGLALARWRTGSDFASLRLANSLRAAESLAVLLIAPKGDPYLDGHPSGRLGELVREFPGMRVWQPECGHLLAVATEPTRYAEEVGRLLDAVVG